MNGKIKLLGLVVEHRSDDLDNEEHPVEKIIIFNVIWNKNGEVVLVRTVEKRADLLH